MNENLKDRVNFKLRRRGRVDIDYSTPLSESLTACHLDNFSKHKFTEKNFPINDLVAKTPTKLSIRFFYDKKNTPTDKIIERMNKCGYKPATLHESAAVIAKYYSLMKKFPNIAVLGSSFHDDEDVVSECVVPVFIFLADMRMLASRSRNCVWSPPWRFIGVRHLSK